MAVFQFTAMSEKSGEDVESGRVVAQNQLDAFDKLKRLNFKDIRLKRLGGLSAFVAQLTAEVR